VAREGPQAAARFPRYRARGSERLHLTPMTTLCWLARWVRARALDELAPAAFTLLLPLFSGARVPWLQPQPQPQRDSRAGQRSRCASRWAWRSCEIMRS